MRGLGEFRQGTSVLQGVVHRFPEAVLRQHGVHGGIEQTLNWAGSGTIRSCLTRNRSASRRDDPLSPTALPQSGLPGGLRPEDGARDEFLTAAWLNATTPGMCCLPQRTKASSTSPRARPFGVRV